MAKTKKRAKSKTSSSELDSVYVLKLVLYIVIGAQWLRFSTVSGSTQIPIPIGLLIGLLFVTHEHFAIDRRIEYAVLLIAMLVGFFTQVGLYIAL